MGFALRVVFQGVLAFVPDTPFFSWEHGKPKQGMPKFVWVLLPELRQPDLADWDRTYRPQPPEQMTFRHSHQQLVSVAAKYVSGGNSLAGFDKLLAAPEGNKRQLVRLIHRPGRGAVFAELRITSQGKPVAGDFEANTVVPRKPYREDPTKEGITDEERTSLWWMPQIVSIAEEFGLAKREANPDSKFFDPLSVGISAVIRLGVGRLSTLDFNTSGQKIWPFSHADRNAKGKLEVEDLKSSRWKKAIGNTFLWEVWIERSSADLQLHYPSENAVVSYKLRPPLLGKRKVTVVVGNMEPERLLAESKEKAILDPDFQVFYSLAHSKGSPKKRYPRDPAPPIGKFGRPCAGGGFSGFAS